MIAKQSGVRKRTVVRLESNNQLKNEQINKLLTNNAIERMFERFVIQ